MLTDQEIVAIMRDGNNCNHNDEAEHIAFARAVLAAAQAKPDTARMVALEHHNRLTSHGMQWTDQRLDANGLNCARAVFGTCNEDDDRRVYRTIQAYLAATPGAEQPQAHEAARVPAHEAMMTECRRECDDDYTKRGTFISGWLGAEAHHGIKATEGGA